MPDSEILSVYALAVPKQSNEREIKIPSDELEESCRMMCSKLLSVLDLRLRQTEGKTHLPLGDSELKAILSIFKSASVLDGCDIAAPLQRRLVERIITNPDLWTEDNMVRKMVVFECPDIVVS